MWRKRDIPNYLTYLRIAVIPPVVAAVYLPGVYGPWISSLLFLLAAVTDYFDGYLARNWEVSSKIGRFLDPIADKLLVCAVLVALVDRGPLQGWHILPVIAILCREILVSGLREHLSELQVRLPVSRLAKWKTATQLTALFLLLLGEQTPAWLGGAVLGIGLFWLAALLTLQSGFLYLRHSLRHFEG